MFNIVGIDCSIYDLSSIKGSIKSSINGSIRAFICSCPTNGNFHIYNDFMKQNKITDLFCFSDLSYDITKLDPSVTHHLLPFHDGSNPPNDVLKKFDKEIDRLLNNNSKPIIECNIMLHCIAGLGRAPIVLAYLMVSRFNFEKEEAVSIIRFRRRGSINSAQLKWLLSLKPNPSCSVM